MLDLDAYLERIGLRGRPSIIEVHRAHATSIPFENLDPHRGVPVSLDPADLERKLVFERRGGYCFEHNLLLKAALEGMGAEVEVLLARVRAGAAPGTLRPRTHAVLRVASGGDVYHADVGFGHGTPLEPLPFGPGGEHEQSGWRFRVVEEGPQLVLQSVDGEDWVDLYAFAADPSPPIDVEVSNWFASTNPSSPFVDGLIVCASHTDGTRAVLSDRDGLALVERTPARTESTPVEWRDLPGLLAAQFGLDGFALRGDGRLELAELT